MSAGAVAVLCVELIDIEPLIWRRVAVGTATNLQTLHRIVQAAVGWLDYHLWEFTAEDKTYGVPDPEDAAWGHKVYRASSMTLARLVADGVTDFDYTYDMGDNWEHHLAPGPMATGIFGKGAGLRPDEANENPEYAEAAIAAVLPRWQPLPYVGRADDIAQAALFLAIDASRMVTGHVDGGITAGRPVAVARDDIALFRRTFRASRARRDLHKPKPVR
jgi:hypothetical protein